jgi:hypothetical protein
MATIPQKYIYDVENKVLRNTEGTQIATDDLYPSASFGTKFTINLQLVSGAELTPYTKLTPGSSAEIIIDNDYSNPSPLLDLPGDINYDFWKISTSSEYYYNDNDIAEKPKSVVIDNSESTEGTVGSLAAGEWGWDETNKKLVVRLSDSTDPDTKGDGFIQIKLNKTFTKPFVEVDSATFNTAGSWYDTNSETFRTPNVANGEISFIVNANTLQFYNRIASNPSVEASMQIQLLAPGDPQIYQIIEMQFYCKNIYLGQNHTVELSGINFYTKAESDARYMQKAGADDIEVTDPAKGFIVTDRSDGTRYRFFVDNGILGIESV